MTVLWSGQDAAAATDGALQGPDWAATGVSIDTRSLAPGDLFVALTNQRDGHDFVADALAKGAAAALVARVPAGVPDDAPLLVVDDVQAALTALGRAGRARTKARVVAVTGSVGKTSTKEMLRAALAPAGHVHAADKSFNNHWGVPLTLARCPIDADIAVIEIGMNHPGEIAPLAAIAAPDVAVVTIVALAHLEAFADGLPGIAREKAAIFTGLRPGGTAIFNADLETSGILRDGAGAARAVPFGAAADAAWRLGACEVTDTATRFIAHGPVAEVLVTLQAGGRHHAMNALAALAAAHALGLEAAAAAEALAAWRQGAGRGARERVVIDAATDAGFDLIDDAYNANPTSVAAALEGLAATAPDGRRVAILGDMLELGADEAAIHAGLAAVPAMEGIDIVHCAGPRMRHLHDALPPIRRGLWCDSAAELADQAAALVGIGDVALVKGSNGARMALLVDALRGLGQGEGHDVQDIPSCSTG